MLRMKPVFALLAATALVAASTVQTQAGPPDQPSSFYGEIHILDNTPTTGIQVLAYVTDVATPVGATTIIDYLGNLVYSIDVRADDTDTPAKDGGLENDLIRFEIGGRVVLTGYWHKGTNVNRPIHPPDATVTYTGPVNEGSPVTLDASATADWGTDIDTYAFDCENDGFSAPGPSATAQCTFPDNGTYIVGVRVIDHQGGVSTDTTSVAVTNATPAVNAGGDTSIDEGSAFAGTGSFTDPGADTWTATVNYGDGTTGSLTLSDKAFSLNHTYAQDGQKTVTVCVKDDENAEGCDSLVVTVGNVAPAFDLGAGANILEGGTFALPGSFTDPGADTWTATVNYGDGGGATDLALSDKAFSLSHVYAQEGNYTVEVCIKDATDATPVCDSLVVTVGNVAPTFDLGADTNVLEGGTFTRNGSFTDPGADTWTATVDYGDGSAGAALSLNADKTFDLSHLYVQDGPFTVQVCIKDATTATPVCDSLVVTVGNVTPVVNAGGDGTVNEGGTFTRDGSFTDPGADTWTATVNYGDGSTDQTLTLTGKTFSLSHPYGDAGVYPVTVKVSDDHIESTASFNVTVNNVTPTAVDAGGPYELTAGQTIVLQGTATCVTGDTCTYAWDLDNNGEYDNAAVATPSVKWNVAGNYTIGLRVTDDEGTFATDTAQVTVLPASQNIALGAGWNLVSFNLIPADTNIASVLASVATRFDLVYAWAGATQTWLKYDNVAMTPDDLDTLTEHMGFWIHMQTPGTLIVAGSVPEVSNIALHGNGSGWNLVGYPALTPGALPGALSNHGAGAFSIVYAYMASDAVDPWKVFDTAAPAWSNDLTQMSPYWGYWIKATANATWHVEYP